MQCECFCSNGYWLLAIGLYWLVLASQAIHKLIPAASPQPITLQPTELFERKIFIREHFEDWLSGKSKYFQREWKKSFFGIASHVEMTTIAKISPLLSRIRYQKTNQIEQVSTEGDITHDRTRFRESEYLVWLVITKWIGQPCVDRSAICFCFFIM